MEPRHIGVFTAVDGTLLHAHTFEAGASRTMIRRLHARDIPVIPVSVMTLEEIAPIAAELGMRQAMVIEGGGAIARWSKGRWEVEPCGPSADAFLDVIMELEDRSGASLLVYSAMDESLAARTSGRRGSMLEASKHRCFSEPFVIESGNVESIRRAAAKMGFVLRRGRRFFHLCHECDKAEAFVRVRDELRCDVAIAVGGAPIDAEFLRRAEIAIIVPGPDGTADPDLLANVPKARVAPAPGPEGWASAVDDAVRRIAKPSRRRPADAAARSANYR